MLDEPMEPRRWGDGWTCRYPGERPAVDCVWPTADQARRAALRRLAWPHNLQLAIEDLTRTLNLASFWRLRSGTRVMAEAPIFGPDDVTMAQANAEMCGLTLEIIELNPCETVLLHDGPELQHMVPGVAPVPMVARQIAQELQRRTARRGVAPLPSGGLFDDVARDQQDLFT